jgi:hypothetical protein
MMRARVQGKTGNRGALGRCTAFMGAVLVTGLAAAMSCARAEPLSFDELYQGVSECRFDLSRYNDVPMEPYAEALLISLPMAGAVHGLLVDTFYFAPAKDGKGESYGLVFNAPLEVVIDAIPELAGRATVNGYLRRLSRLSDDTGDRSASRRTLLVCAGGTDA